MKSPHSYRSKAGDMYMDEGGGRATLRKKCGYLGLGVCTQTSIFLVGPVGATFARTAQHFDIEDGALDLHPAAVCKRPGRSRRCIPPLDFPNEVIVLSVVLSNSIIQLACVAPDPALSRRRTLMVITPTIIFAIEQFMAL